MCSAWVQQLVDLNLGVSCQIAQLIRLFACTINCIPQWINVIFRQQFFISWLAIFANLLKSVGFQLKKEQGGIAPNGEDKGRPTTSIKEEEEERGLHLELFLQSFDTRKKLFYRWFSFSRSVHICFQPSSNVSVLAQFLCLLHQPVQWFILNSKLHTKPIIDFVYSYIPLFYIFMHSSMKCCY